MIRVLSIFCIAFVSIQLVSAEGERIKRQSRGGYYKCPDGFRQKRSYSCRERQDRRGSGHGHYHSHEHRADTRLGSVYPRQLPYTPYSTFGSITGLDHRRRPYDSHESQGGWRGGSQGSWRGSGGGRRGGRIDEYRQWIEDCCYHDHGRGHGSDSHERGRGRGSHSHERGTSIISPGSIVTPGGTRIVTPGGGGFISSLLGSFLGGGSVGGGNRVRDVCSLHRDSGYRCSRNSGVHHYYYDHHTHRCKKFYHLGCGGNQNNFHSYQECRDYCRGH